MDGVDGVDGVDGLEGMEGLGNTVPILKYELDQVYLFYEKKKFNFIIVLKTIF